MIAVPHIRARKNSFNKSSQGSDNNSGNGGGSSSSSQNNSVPGMSTNGTFASEFKNLFE